MTIDLRLGDCLEVMPTLPEASIDLVLADLPYGVSNCKWDVVIPFGPLWTCYRRLLKPRGAVVLTASQPFTSMLVMSNREWFKYCWVWEKSRSTDFINAKNKPLRSHEDVAVFSSGTTANCSQNKMIYNPQGLRYEPFYKKRLKPIANDIMGTRPGRLAEYPVDFIDYPKSIIRIPSEHNGDTIHPTQKPVALMEYLIKTYSNPGDTILDNTMGSGTTLVACINTDRNGIGIEKHEPYYRIAQKRIAEAESDVRSRLNFSESLT